MLPYLYKCLQCTYFVKKQIRNQKSLKEMSRIRILPFFPPTKQVSYLCCRAKLLPNQPTKPNNTHKRQSLVRPSRPFVVRVAPQLVGPSVRASSSSLRTPPHLSAGEWLTESSRPSLYRPRRRPVPVRLSSQQFIFINPPPVVEDSSDGQHSACVHAQSRYTKLLPNLHFSCVTKYK